MYYIEIEHIFKETSRVNYSGGRIALRSLLAYENPLSEGEVDGVLKAFCVLSKKDALYIVDMLSELNPINDKERAKIAVAKELITYNIKKDDRA